MPALQSSLLEFFVLKDCDLTWGRVEKQLSFGGNPFFFGFFGFLLFTAGSDWQQLSEPLPGSPSHSEQNIGGGGRAGASSVSPETLSDCHTIHPGCWSYMDLFNMMSSRGRKSSAYSHNMRRKIMENVGSRRKIKQNVVSHIQKI